MQVVTVQVIKHTSPEPTKKGAVLSRPPCLDIDKLNWSDDDLRAYLFALNSPDLFSAPEDELDKMELQLKHDFESISFGDTRVQNSVRQCLERESHQISKIILTHPLYALTPDTTGQMEFWDTPGPNAVETEFREAQAESVRRRALSDRETYLNALKRADALLVIFDVMQQEAESQDEIFRTVKDRQGASGSVLLIANKVDQRQSRDAIPLDDVLAGIQRDAYERYDGMRLRKPIPNASKPAQLAREVARIFEEHPDYLNDVDELLKRHPEYKYLIDDYEKSEDRRARRFSKDKPWLGVEEFSGIKGTEQALRDFFKQETGRSVLRNCVKTLYQFLTQNHERTSRQLAVLTAERDDLVKVRKHLEQGQADLNKLQTHHRDRFEQIEASVKSEVEENAKSYEQQALNELDAKLSELYGSKPIEINKSDFKGTIHQRDIDNMVRAQRVLIEERIRTSESLKQMLSLADEQAELCRRVKRDVDTELGLNFIYPSLQAKSKFDHKVGSTRISISFEKKIIKDEDLIESGAKTGAIAGAFGGAMLAGFLLAPFTGGMSIVAASAAAGGAAIVGGVVGGGGGELLGRGIASLFADEEEVECYPFKNLRTTLRTELKSQLRHQCNHYIDEIKSHLQMSLYILHAHGQSNLDNLNHQIRKTEDKINSPDLQDEIQRHERDQAELSRSVEAISAITRNLEIS